jgi:uncharacterized protein YkwD
MRTPGPLALGLLALLALCGCSGVDLGSVGGVFSARRATTAGAVSAADAARLISNYRGRHGLPPVAVDERLNRIAADHARLMASADRIAHVLPGEGSFQHRLAAGGFVAAQAAENIGGGYKSLDDALDGWRDSADHDANLLRVGVSEIGIAMFMASDSTYKTYWSLILAAPYVPPAPPLQAGPIAPVGR